LRVGCEKLDNLCKNETERVRAHMHQMNEI